MKKTLLFVTFLFLASMTVSAIAQDKTPVVDQREKNQQERIKQGVKTGELTKREARRLEMQQGKIKADEMRAKADGKVTNAERRQLKREQNRASKNVYRKKHNNKAQK